MTRVAPPRFASREHELLLPFDLKRAGGDVVHSPAQDPPRLVRMPWVQTLHGLLPLARRSPEHAGERRLWARWGPAYVARTAVIAVSEFCARQGVELLGLAARLKVVGRVAPWYRERIGAELAGSPRPELIDLLGYVGEGLPALYRGASALAVTRRDESFCLPALEVMATGTPVVAYSNTALPEIAGGAGRLVRDGDLRQLADATAAVLRDRRGGPRRGL